MSIRYFEKEKVFLLNGRESTYAFGIVNGMTFHRHWGARVETPDELPSVKELQRRTTWSVASPDSFQEYRAFGGDCVNEAAVNLVFADGTRSAYLRYVSHEIDGDCLRVLLRDTVFPVSVTLFYRVIERFDVIERRAVIRNEGAEPFRIERAATGLWFLPHRDEWRLTYFAGAYGHEMQRIREPILPGRRVLETRRGLSGPDAAPLILIDEGDATETAGSGYFLSVLWSGNWKIAVERDHLNRVVIGAGENDFDFGVTAEAGQEYESPMVFCGYSDAGGFGAITRKMHRYERAEIVHPTERGRILPVIYNTHGSLVNRTCEENVLREVDEAHEAGIELFVLDGGWTGTEGIDSPTNNGQAHRLGFGSWTVNPARFPHGLRPISDRLHGYGMKFGLWIEPESVFRTNETALEHPDWLLRYPGREPEKTGWGCYHLNMANDEACDFVTERMLSLVRENSIDYIKNDFNSTMAQMGWQGVPPEHQREVHEKYVRNMWKCYSALKEEFPDLIFENSAGGGKRLDLGMLRFAGRMHRSDNQDPVDSVVMHEGFTYFLPSKFAGGACFVSDRYTRWLNRRDTTMEFQAHVGMMSGLSVSLKFSSLPPERMAELKRLLALNREIRGTVQLGDLYRLASTYDKPYGAFEFLDEDGSRAVVFVLGINEMFAHVNEPLRLQGLEPDARYLVTGHGTYYPTLVYPHHDEDDDTPVHEKDYGVRTGRSLMNVGVQVILHASGTSEVLTVRRI